MLWKLARRSVLVACVLMLLGPALAPAQGCACGPSPEYFLPEAVGIGQGFIVIDTIKRDQAELAATFASPTNASIRLDAWGWAGQATRTYERGSLAVEVSVHMFVQDEGAHLAMPWFAEQRAEALGLHRDPPPRSTETPSRPMLYQAVVSGIRTSGLNDYTLYAQSGQLLVRVSVTSPQDDSATLANLATAIMQRVSWY